MVQQQLWPPDVSGCGERAGLADDGGLLSSRLRRSGGAGLQGDPESGGEGAVPLGQWWPATRTARPFTPNPSQAQVLAHESGPLLVLGGPGTGKTRTLGELVRRRLSPGPRGLRAEQVLMLTSGRASAASWRDQLAAGLPPGAALPEVASLHSFAYGVLRAADPLPVGDPLRLLTAAEQEARLRELLSGATADGRLSWPAGMIGAVGTRGIAEEVRKLLHRARGLGLDGKGLRRLGRSAGIAAWEVLGPFLEEYLDILGFEGSIDYGELLHRTLALANDQRRGERLRAQFQLVVVDEFQDVEPIQVALLRALTRQGAALVVAGDPDQAIFGFRGGDVRALREFPQRCADAAGQPAPTVVLARSYRCPAAILSAASHVRGAGTLAPLPLAVQRAVRETRPAAAPSGEPTTRVRVATYPTAGAEASAIADALWQERARGWEWSQMAVIVRSPAAHGGQISHSLAAAGIPLQTSGDDLPLAQESAVTELLRWLTAATGSASPGWAVELLTGPIGGVDPVSARIAARSLVGVVPVGSARPHWPEVLAGALEDADASLIREANGDPALSEALLRCGRLLGQLRAQTAAEASVHELLWAVWQASSWPERLRERALAGGAPGRRADRHLDAVLALFDVAERMPEQTRGEAGVRAFLAEVQSRQIPTDRWGRRGARSNVVELLSAHRVKGRAWPVVVLAGVQAGEWPNPQFRSEILRVGELAREGAQDPLSPADLLRSERRLFFTAVTRASERLLVTAVADPAEGGDQPSRFLAELGVAVEQVTDPRGFGRASGAGIVTGLREVALSARRLGQAELAGAAAARLAALGDRELSDLYLPKAHEREWWQASAVTPGLVALAPTGQPINLSGSAVTALRDCPLRWFLDRRAGAAKAGSEAMAVGLLMHTLAEQVARGELPAQAEALNQAVDEVWPALRTTAVYQTRRERERVRKMIDSFLAWHRQRGGACLAVEHNFQVRCEVPTPDGPRAVRLRGFLDRVDQDEAGGVHLVDFKTARTPVSKGAAAEHPQLAVYQLAALHGALAGLGLGPGHYPLRGAELVFLSAVSARSGLPAVRPQAACAGDSWVAELVGAAAHTLASEDFRARPGEQCKRCPHRRICPAHQVRLELCDEGE